MIAETDLSEAQLQTALDYYRRFPEEIDDFIALDRQPLENLREQYPHADVISVSAEQRSPKRLRAPSRPALPGREGA